MASTSSRPSINFIPSSRPSPKVEVERASPSIDFLDIIVTSGIYERFIEKDGKVYHHMINPATGYPFENNLSSVTIISVSWTVPSGSVFVLAGSWIPTLKSVFLAFCPNT